MTQDVLKQPIQDWLMDQRQSRGIRQVGNLPIALASDIGIKRTENQDRVLLLRAQVTAKKAFIVGVLCDGMGGMDNGSDCATIAAATFIANCVSNRNLPIKERLLTAVKRANDNVYIEYKGKGGATLSAFLIDNDGAFEVVNVGDSRIYLMDNQKLSQITTDDTIAGQLAKTSDDNQFSQQLLQYVGMGAEIEPHCFTPTNYSADSKLLLTSDGTHYIAKQTLADIVRQQESALDICQRIVDVAKWCGGHDNASAIVLSDFDTLFLQQHPPGTIQVWDPFDSCQFLTAKSDIEQSTPTQKALQQQENKNSDNSPIKNDNKAKVTRKGKDKSLVEVPQMKINFG